MQTAVSILFRNRNNQTQVGFGHFAFCLACLHFTGSHLFVDGAQVRQRQDNTCLQVNQFLLQFFDGRDVTCQHDAVCMLAVHFAVNPVQIGFIAREDFDEVAARHAATIDCNIKDLLFDVAHFIHLAAQRVAQFLDDFCGEADAQQLIRNDLLCLDVWFRVVALFLERFAHLVELLGDGREFGERITLQLFQLFARETRGAGSGGGFFFFLFFFLFLFFVFFVIRRSGRSRSGDYRFCRIHIDQAVDDFVDLGFVFRDTFSSSNDFCNRGRACGDRLDHVAQAVFNTFCDVDFAFACQQFNRTHFAHVHTHRIGGTAEIGVDGRQCRFCSSFGFIIAGNGRDVVGQQQGFCIRCLFVDRDTHVIEGTDDAFDRFRIDDVFRQVIVDFCVGQEAAFLTELDQRLEFLATRFEFFFAGFCIGRECVFQQCFFFGLAIFGFRFVDGFQFCAFDRIQCRDFIVLRLEFFWLTAATARHFDRRQDVTRGVDRSQGGGVGSLADGRRDHDVYARTRLDFWLDFC
ncbi:hypothetical protein D3C71_96950 [compost metagenome]